MSGALRTRQERNFLGGLTAPPKPPAARMATLAKTSTLHDYAPPPPPEQDQPTALVSSVADAVDTYDGQTYDGPPI